MKLWLVLLVALAGCQKAEPPPLPRLAADSPATARSVTHKLPLGEMTVMEIPLTGAGRLTEYQTCFLWREDGHRALQCPNDRASYSVDPPAQ